MESAERWMGSPLLASWVRASLGVSSQWEVQEGTGLAASCTGCSALRQNCMAATKCAEVEGRHKWPRAEWPSQQCSVWRETPSLSWGTSPTLRSCLGLLAQLSCPRTPKGACTPRQLGTKGCGSSFLPQSLRSPFLIY